MPITWVTLDSYQSVDTMQILRAEGFFSGYQSVDTSIIPYQLTKNALYDGRVRIGKHPKLLHELLNLELDYKRGKVDHVPNGSKDVADAFAGVVYGLTMRREVWGQHGVSPVNSISVMNQMKKEDSRPTALSNDAPADDSVSYSSMRRLASDT